MTFDLANAPFSSSSPWNQTIKTGSTYTKLNWPASTGYNYSQTLPLVATGLGILGSIVIARYYAKKGRARGAAARAAHG